MSTYQETMKSFSADQRGTLRADLEGKEKIIGWFLEQDIQGSKAVCQIYISALEAVRTGEMEEWDGTGNAFTVTANKVESKIIAEYTESSLSTTTERLLECLEGWLRHIESQQE